MPRAVVTGAAGFLGSHLSTRILDEGWDVIGFDNLVTGRIHNVVHLEHRPGFDLRHADVSTGFDVPGEDVDAVFHFASPASPVDYQRHPIETLRVGSLGTQHALDLAVAKQARFVHASTSEVYGDPLVHPQPEGYWGNVNPVGPRSMYDEAKRYAEALAMAYHRVHGLDVKLPRIFNTYGRRMRRDDGRAVPTFVSQAIRDEPITVQGNGSQTRSLCHVDDLIEGIWRLACSAHVGPMNVGNPHEVTVLELAERVRSAAGSRSEIVFVVRAEDDPERRRPDIGLARSVLGWEPRVSLDDGLADTVAWGRAAWMA
jgi:nucleoside-diphosphate-sugar epimerase